MEKMVYAIEWIMEQERLDGENKKAMDIAKKLINKGTPIEEIASHTDLPLPTIQELARFMNE